MFKAATVSIVHEDARTAGKQVGQELSAELGSRPDVVVLFASSIHDARDVLSGLSTQLSPSTKIIGCSSHAEINSDEVLSESVTAMGFKLGDLAAEVFMVAPEGRDSIAIGRALGADIRPFAPDALLLLADGFSLDGSRFLAGVQEALGRHLPIFGGMAADQGEFVRTYQLMGQDIITGGAVALALKGRLRVVAGAWSGFRPVSPRKVCTRMEGHKTILEIDGRPALNLYREYLAASADGMKSIGIEFPLAVMSPADGDDRLADRNGIQSVCAIFGIDDGRQALQCLGDIPEHAEVCVATTSREELVAAAESAVTSLCAELPDPDVAFFFECLGRKNILGPSYQRELDSAFTRLKGVPKIGFYTVGEIAPVQTVARYHNETLAMALLKRV